MRAKFLILCGLMAAFVMARGATAGAPEFVLVNPTIVAGGTVSPCAGFTLTSTIGEAAAGTVSAGGWRMVSGFPATLPDPPPRPDSVFKDGFETVVIPTFIAIAKGACAP